MKGEKLVGTVVSIKSRSFLAGYGRSWGIIVHYDGDRYHIAPWCDNLEIAKEHGSLVFDRDEFTVKRAKKI